MSTSNAEDAAEERTTFATNDAQPAVTVQPQPYATTAGRLRPFRDSEYSDALNPIGMNGFLKARANSQKHLIFSDQECP